MREDQEQISARREERQLLLERIASGLSPEEAQLQADSLGLKALLPLPDATDYDPMRLSDWTLLMAWSWVAFRELTHVRSADNAFFQSLYFWSPVSIGQGRVGHVMMSRQPRYLHEVATTPWDDEVSSVNGARPQAHWRELKDRVSTGSIRTFGRDVTASSDGKIEEIPHKNWAALKLGHCPDTAPVPRADMLHFGDGVPVYVDVVVSRQDLMREFEPRRNPNRNDVGTDEVLTEPQTMTAPDNVDRNIWPAPDPARFTISELALLNVLRTHFSKEPPRYSTVSARNEAIWALAPKVTGRSTMPTAKTFERFFAKMRP